jgi:hypothetical protein
MHKMSNTSKYNVSYFEITFLENALWHDTIGRLKSTTQCEAYTFFLWFIIYRFFFLWATVLYIFFMVYFLELYMIYIVLIFLINFKKIGNKSSQVKFV